MKFSEFLKTINIFDSLKSYRKDPALSYSFLKDLYYSANAFKYKEKSKSLFMDIGSAVDTLLTDEPDNQIPITIIDSIPTGQVLDVLNYLADKYRNGFPILSDLPEEIIEEAYDYIGSKSRISYEKRVQALKEFEPYFIAKVNADKDIILTKELYDIVIMIVDMLKTFPKTSYLFNNDNLDIVNFYQFKYKTKIDTIDFRVMFDIISVNEKEKIISPKDLKIGSINSNNDFFNSFYMFKWYYQATLYRKLLLKLYTEYRKLEGSEKYIIEDFQFVYVNVNTINYPRLYNLKKEITDNLFYKDIIDDRRIIPSIMSLTMANYYYNKVIKENPNIDPSDIIPYNMYLDDFEIEINSLI